jgi:hypothetical protein
MPPGCDKTCSNDCRTKFRHMSSWMGMFPRKLRIPPHVPRCYEYVRRVKSSGKPKSTTDERVVTPGRRLGLGWRYC